MGYTGVDTTSAEQKRANAYPKEALYVWVHAKPPPPPPRPRGAERLD